MENKTNHESSSDVGNQNQRNDESEEINRNNDDEEKVKQAKGEEGKSGGNKIIAESRDQNDSERKNRAISSPGNEETPGNCSTPVLGNPSSTSVNYGTCPDPPARPSRKSKISIQAKEGEKKTHEKTHGERRESENDLNKENERENTEKINDEGSARKEKPNTSSQIKKENKNNESDETTNTKENETRGRNSIRDRNKITKSTKKEATPTAENKVKDSEKSEENAENTLVGLKKELGLFNCVGIIVGNIIGTGIFVSPRAVLQYTGSVGMSLIVWVVSGVMAIVGAFCYAELGTMIPQSGGNYSYLFEAYGPLPAFINLWMTVVIGIPGGRAVAALTFANYVLQPFFPNEQAPPDAALRIVGILLLLLLTFINIRAVRWATRVQDTMALTKVFALIMIIVVGLFHLYRGSTDNYERPMEGTSTDLASVVTAFYHTVYAYEGWDSLNNIMEELKDPFRNMPRAIAISVTSVIIIYILTNVAYFAVLPKEVMLASPAVAVTFGNLALGVMAWTIPIFVACSVSGGLNGSTFANSRLMYVSARRGHLPRVISFVHVDNNTPVVSLIFVAIMSMMMFVTSDVRVLINYLSFAGNLMAFLSVSTFFWFRWKHPDLARPIKVWIGFPLIYLVLSFFLVVIPVIKQPLEVVAAVFVLATGLPVYYFLVYKEEKPKRLFTAMDKVTYLCQLLFMAVPEEKTN